MEDFNILSREHEGDEIDGDAFYMSEEAHMTRMEKINGASIQDLIMHHEFYKELIETLDLEKITLQLETILAQLHDQEFVHGDVSIRNIMIDEETGEPRLIDFGTSGFNKIGISAERDLDHLKECLRHLRGLMKNPEGKREAINL